MKITKSYLKQVIKEEIENLKETATSIQVTDRNYQEIINNLVNDGSREAVQKLREIALDTNLPPYISQHARYKYRQLGRGPGIPDPSYEYHASPFEREVAARQPKPKELHSQGSGYYDPRYLKAR